MSNILNFLILVHIVPFKGILGPDVYYDKRLNKQDSILFSSYLIMCHSAMIQFYSSVILSLYSLFISYGLSPRKVTKEAGLFTPKGSSTHILSMTVCISCIAAMYLYSKNEYSIFSVFRVIICIELVFDIHKDLETYFHFENYTRYSLNFPYIGYNI